VIYNIYANQTAIFTFYNTFHGLQGATIQEKKIWRVYANIVSLKFSYILYHHIICVSYYFDITHYLYLNKIVILVSNIFHNTSRTKGV